LLLLNLLSSEHEDQPSLSYGSAGEDEDQPSLRYGSAGEEEDEIFVTSPIRVIRVIRRAVVST